jgi:Polyketide cyclase / dehydrase and lipid transport
MTQIVVAINIHRPIGAVFDYVTTPANWPAWHPASRAVSGSVDHSLLIGEQVTEEFVVGGRHGSCVWQVTQREMPYLWTITTSTPRFKPKSPTDSRRMANKPSSSGSSPMPRPAFGFGFSIFS